METQLDRLTGLYNREALRVAGEQLLAKIVCVGRIPGNLCL